MNAGDPAVKNASADLPSRPWFAMPNPMATLSESLVETDDALAACCAHLGQCTVIGMDTEFVGENSYHPELCLIQIATDSALYLIDPFAFPSLADFWNIIVDPSRTVVTHAGREEVRLCHLACGQAPPNLVDLQIAAGLVGYPYPLGHGPLIQHVLGHRIKKTDTLTEWRHRPLAASQIRYAFDDVRFLLPVWAKLDKKLHEMNRVSWAQEEFARLREIATPELPSEESVGDRWRKLRGLGALDRRKLAFVKELYQWREAKAHEWNRPARVIVRDDLLIEIARRAPKSPRDFAVIRGLSHKFLDEFFALYQKTQNRPIDDCPIPLEREQDPPQVSLAVTLMSAVLPDFAARSRIAPGLMATVADLRALVRAFASGQRDTLAIQLTKGWRAREVLPHFVAILEGRRGLRVHDLTNDAPLEYRDW
jgi:ribonuclease D